MEFLNWLSGMVWNQYFIYAFLLIGLFFTIMTRFVQVSQDAEGYVPFDIQ